MKAMHSLYFEKISQFDRAAEPVTVSIPFAAGKLPAPENFVLYDEDRPLATQRRSLSSWPDGSVKWLLVHAQVDLPGNQDKTLHFKLEQAPSRLVPEKTVGLAEQASGILVNTGPLSFFVPREGFLPLRDVKLEGQPLWGEAPFSGFELTCSGQKLSTRRGPVTLRVEEAGPLRAVITVKGKHLREDGRSYLDFHGRVTAFAGKTHLEVEHQFLHREAEEDINLERLELRFRPTVRGAPQLALGEGYYRTAIQESRERLELALTAETLLYQSNEHFIDSFYGDFWTDWRDERAGLTLSVHQAHQNFPKALYADSEGIVCSLYPRDAAPCLVLQGMAKTHRLQLHVHPPGMPLGDCSVRSLQFQLPDRPAITHAYRLTGDARYLEVAARQFAALLETPIGFAQGGKYLDASGAVIAGVGRGRIFADKYTSILLWAGAAAPRGLLDWYDYPSAPKPGQKPGGNT